MRTKNQASIIRKTFYVIMLLSIFLSVFGTGGMSAAHAAERLNLSPDYRLVLAFNGIVYAFSLDTGEFTELGITPSNLEEFSPISDYDVFDIAKTPMEKLNDDYGFSHGVWSLDKEKIAYLAIQSLTVNQTVNIWSSNGTSLEIVNLREKASVEYFDPIGWKDENTLVLLGKKLIGNLSGSINIYEKQINTDQSPTLVSSFEIPQISGSSFLLNEEYLFLGFDPQTSNSWILNLSDYSIEQIPLNFQGISSRDVEVGEITTLGFVKEDQLAGFYENLISESSALATTKINRPTPFLYWPLNDTLRSPTYYQNFPDDSPWRRGMGFSSTYSGHQGTDILVPIGNTVYASGAGQGKVAIVNIVCTDLPASFNNFINRTKTCDATKEKDSNKNGLGYFNSGNVIILEYSVTTRAGNAKKIYVFYGHLKSNSQKSGVYEGAYVSRGQALAETGHNGISSAPHLHFDIRYSLLGFYDWDDPWGDSETPHTQPDAGTMWVYQSNPTKIISAFQPTPTCPQSGGVILYYWENYKCGDGVKAYRIIRQYVYTGYQGYNIDADFNDEAWSIRIPANQSVMLFPEPNLTGSHRACFNASTPNFNSGFALNIKGRVSSLAIFAGTNCGGFSSFSLPESSDSADLIYPNSGTPPTMPNSLLVNSATSNSITLGWTDASNDEVGFNIYRWGFNGTYWDFLYHDTVGSDETTYTDVALDCESDYFYTVTAYNGSGESVSTDWVMGTTSDCAAVANDDFNSPTVISQNNFTDSLNVGGATWALDDPDIVECNQIAPDQSVWYSFTAPFDGQLYINTLTSTYDTVLAVWTGTRGNLAPVGCNDDSSSPALQSELNVDLLSGTTYYIEVGKFYNYLVAEQSSQTTEKIGSPGRDVASLSIDTLNLSMEFVSKPANDEIGNATIISQTPYTDSLDTTGATKSNTDLPLTSCGRDPGKGSVWYKYTAPSTGQIYLDTQGSNYDTMLALWTGTPGNLVLVSCNDDTAVNLQSELNEDVANGTTYYIEVAQFWDYLSENLSAQSIQKPGAGDVSALAGGLLTLNMDFVTGPINDELASAESITTLPYNHTLNSLGATSAIDDPAIPACDLAPGRSSVWYQYNPPENQAVQFDTLASDYDTYIAVWSGSPGNLSLITCNDDYDQLAGIYQSSITANLSAGVTYYIEVAEWNGYNLTANSIGVTKQVSDIQAQAGGMLKLHAEVDITAPQVSTILRDSTSPTALTTVDFIVKFTESVAEVDTIAPFDDFLLTSTGVSNASISNVEGSGDLYIVTVNTGTGDGTLRLDVPNTASITDVGGIPLSGLPFESGEVYTVTKTIIRAILPSNGSQDGWVRESTETSETGGTVDSAASILIVGDDASDRQYRSILSFDTSSLPDTAVITQAVLSLRVNEILGGGNPIKTFNYFMADVMNGSFGTSASLAAQDFGFSPTVTAGPLGVLNRGGWYYVDIKTGKAAISTTDITQIRLRFNIGDNDNGIENIIKIFSGNSAIKPQLSLWYYVP